MKTATTSLQLALTPEAGLLKPVPGCEEGVLALDVAEGCAAACVHCVGGHSGEKYGAPTQVTVVANAAARLEAELEGLAGQGRRPSRIRLGWASDPLLPIPELRTVTQAVMQVALDRGVAVELHTRNVVPEDVVQLMKAHRHMVHLVVGVMSVRDSAVRVYEPELPPPAGRLRAVRPLLAAGVPVTLRVEPLVPLVNDTQADLEAVFDLAVKNGVRRVELAYLALTPDTAKSLSRGMPRMHREMLRGLFAEQPWLPWAGGSRKLLPRMLREAGYDRALAAARRLGLIPTVCATAEPEIRLARHCVRPLGDTPSGRPSAASSAASSAPPAAKAVAAAAQLGLFGEALLKTR